MIKPSQAITVGFETARFDTGAAADATGTPTGTLVKNGTDTAETVTVTNKATGSYKAAFTVPADAAAGDVFELRVEATVNSVAGKATVWRGVVDTKRVGDLQDLTAAAVNAEADAALADVGVTSTVTGRIDAAVSTRSSHSAADVATAVWGAGTRTLTNLGTVVADVAAAVWAYATRVLTASTNITIPSAASIADAVWDEAQSGHTTAGTFGKYLDSTISGVGGSIGSGSDSTTITLTASSAGVGGARVWLSTDAAGAVVVAGSLVTDDNGEVVFLLDDGNTYYLWAKRAGYADIRGTSFVADGDAGNEFTMTPATGGTGFGGYR